jgi:DnaJ-class molecular chaperone
VRSAYKRLAFQLHPDRYKAEEAQERFSAINEAHEVLSDNDKRRQYDLTRSGVNTIIGRISAGSTSSQQFQEQQFSRAFHQAHGVSEGVVAMCGWVDHLHADRAHVSGGGGGGSPAG